LLTAEGDKNDYDWYLSYLTWIVSYFLSGSLLQLIRKPNRD